jgi:hypothetical protein
MPQPLILILPLPLIIIPLPPTIASDDSTTKFTTIANHKLIAHYCTNTDATTALSKLAAANYAAAAARANAFNTKATATALTS